MFQTGFKEVKKRDGRVVPFDKDRIANAIYKTMEATKEGNLEKDPLRMADKVVHGLEKRFPRNHIPHIEEIQDLVEETLILP